MKEIEFSKKKLSMRYSIAFWVLIVLNVGIIPFNDDYLFIILNTIYALIMIPVMINAMKRFKTYFSVIKILNYEELKVSFFHNNKDDIVFNVRQVKLAITDNEMQFTNTVNGELIGVAKSAYLVRKENWDLLLNFVQGNGSGGSDIGD